MITNKMVCNYLYPLVITLLLLPHYIFAQNVIIVVVDGARYTETFGAGNTYIPHMYNDMRPQGTLYTNFRIADAGKTETNPGHASILSGTWQQIANDGSARPTQPTLFEYFRKELGSSITDNYVVTGKSKLNILSYSTSSGYGSAYQASTSSADVSDNTVYTNLTNIMDTYHPKLILVNFADVDKTGHSGSWTNYLNAITNADNLVYQLWQKIQSDTYYQNTTTLFITNDHGRHTTNFTSHGDDCDGCEHIMLLALGRNVGVGQEISDLHYQMDITPTVGDLLNFSTPNATGTSLYDDSIPLPVVLASFAAETKGNDVKLAWSTATEVNNYEFAVERRAINGQQSAMSNPQWSKVGSVLGYGTSNVLHIYSFTDQKLTSGRYAYRLKQIDNDGTFKYSQSVEVEMEMSTPKVFGLYQNYPNPFNPSTKIDFTLGVSNQTTLKVYNLVGQEVETLFSGWANAGTLYNVDFNASAYANGMYFYVLKSGSRVETKKLILSK